MNLIDLAHECGLQPKRAAATNGGEYKCSCPAPDCGGKDRFIIWPVKGRYWCRQCHKRGDAIQFCRDFMGMSFQQACAKLSIEKCANFSRITNRVTYKRFVPKVTEVPPEKWRANARDFVLRCHQILMQNQHAIDLLSARGLSLETLRDYSLGWWAPNFHEQFLSLPDWGLPQEINENGREKRLWMPKGIVIPYYAGEEPVKLKIRRSEWKEGDKLPKYIEISGSKKCPALYGSVATGAILIVEAELDAILVQQFAGDLCSCMAIGGVGKRPDFDADRLLRRARHLLFSLDFDEAGKREYKFWKWTYPQIMPWPAPRGKSPGDAYGLGVDLKKWILEGLN